MAQKGISREVILAKAVELIEQRGEPTLSMRELAEALEIKTPSLYHHVTSMGELWGDISRYAAEQLRQVQLAAIRGKARDQALCALAQAYRGFAKEHAGLYQVTILLPSLPEELSGQLAERVAEPIFQVLTRYELNREQAIHWQRILRGIIHGFLTQEKAGFFQHAAVSVEESYQLAIRCVLHGLHEEAKES